MLREALKQELDRLNEDELQKIADFIRLISSSSSSATFPSEVPFWQRATPTERACEFRDWVSHLSKTSISLSDEAGSRESIYEE